MEIFIIWAIISAITSWLYNFWFKVITEKNYSTYYSTLWSYSVAAFLAFLFLVYDNFSWFQNISLWLLFLFAFGNIFFFYLSVITRVKSMENIDNVIFYPLYKTFWPILVTCISIFYFQEYLSFYEFLWIIIWILVPLMLITKKESKRQKNLFLWILFMLLTACVGSIAPIFVKLSNNIGFDTMTYVFVSFAIGIIFSYIGHRYESKKTKKVFNIKGIRRFALIIGVLHFMTFYSYVKAFEWNIAIAFTINSFAILIPIILSIFFYNEHFNLRKAFVILLSFLSLFLFL